MASRDVKIQRFRVSLIVFHFLFLTIILFEAPWFSDYYKSQFYILIGDFFALYIFYFLPFLIWHFGDVIQRRIITPSCIACLINFRFALFCFVANMMWGVAYAVDIMDVPGAHEFGTLNFYGVYIGLALLGLAAFASLIKLGTGLFSRFRASGR